MNTEYLDSPDFVEAALQERLTLEVTGIRQEGFACPAQWTVFSADCVELYVRYRYQLLTVHRTVIEEPHGAIAALVFARLIDGPPDMTTSEMLAWTGLRPTEGCVHIDNPSGWFPDLP